jgi:hypothetical protein
MAIRELMTYGLKPMGYQQITDLISATGLTVPAGATAAVVVATGQDVRWRDDGTNPSATVGMPLAAGVERFFPITKGLASLRFIEQTAGAVLNISSYA